MPEGDLIVVIGDETGVGEGDAVSVAAEVFEHGVGSGEGWLDMDVPVEITQGSQVGVKGFVIGEFLVAAEEVETMLVVGPVQLFEQQVPEPPREHFVGQQVAGTAGDPARAVEGDAAAGDDTVDMGMMGHCRAPGVENGGDAEFGAQAFGISGDRVQGLGRGLEHEVVDHGLVLPGDVGDLGGGW